MEPPASLRQAVGGHPILSEILARKGFQTPEAALAFLDPGRYQPCTALAMPDMQLAVDRLRLAIGRKQHIGVWGDFDADGQTATALLVGGLRALGARVSYRIPLRATESHGLHPASLQTFLDSGMEVILTCDTGVAATEGAEICRQRGVDLIITDHHSLPRELPPALAVINPQRLPGDHPLATLSGSGTAYKLLEALYDRYGRAGDEMEFIDLAAIGMVADLALLTGDARYLVQLGLAALRHKPRLAVQAVLDLAEVKENHLTEQHIGFTIGPRLNAIGRLGDANPMIEFLLSTDPAVIRPAALELEGLNGKRKLLCDQVFQAARAQVERDPTSLDGYVLVLTSNTWPGGVIGIVASRLAEVYQCPAILISLPAGEAGRASARSIEGVNITQALAANERFLLGYGGHPMAAGFSIAAEMIPEFKRAINSTVAAMIGDNVPEKKLPITANIPLSEINLELVEQLERLAPFGPGNPAPIFASQHLSLVNQALIGKNKDHLRLLVEEPSGQQMKVIWWQGAGMELPDGKFDLAYAVRASNFRGQKEVEIDFIAARPREEETRVTPRKKIQVLDYRGASDALKLLHALPLEQALIWSEGEFPPDRPYASRYQLKPTDLLVVWTIPPGHTELNQALEVCQPRQVALFALPAGDDSLKAFLTRLTGLIKSVLSRHAGNCAFAELVAATGQRERVVADGLCWLQARGLVNIEWQPAGNLLLRAGDSTDTQQAHTLQDRIDFLVTETALFREFYLRADANALVHSSL